MRENINESYQQFLAGNERWKVQTIPKSRFGVCVQAISVDNAVSFAKKKRKGNERKEENKKKRHQYWFFVWRQHLLYFFKKKK
jgi:hypothetical protein